MVLLIAVILGLIAGYLRAALTNRAYQPQTLQSIGLVFAALIVQWLIFSFELTRSNLTDGLACLLFVFSQIALLVFAWKNQKISGFWLLGFGLVLNLTVIVANGGWMPIRPETISWLTQNSEVASWQIGSRLGMGKDIVLAAETTRLLILSDQLRSPLWFPYRFAFSMGDVMIAAGAFWAFWSIGGGKKYPQVKEIESCQ